MKRASHIGEVLYAQVAWDDRGPYVAFHLHSPTRRPRWIRAGFTFGPAPGSHGIGEKVCLWGCWRGEVEDRGGWALRLFHSFTRPCLTFRIHWRGWLR